MSNDFEERQRLPRWMAWTVIGAALLLFWFFVALVYYLLTTDRSV